MPITGDGSGVARSSADLPGVSSVLGSSSSLPSGSASELTGSANAVNAVSHKEKISNSTGPGCHNIEHDDDDDESSDSEGEDMADVEEEDDVESDTLEEIDTSNIIPSGRRTRGKEIDFVKANAEAGDLDDDEGADDDFVETNALE